MEDPMMQHFKEAIPRYVVGNIFLPNNNKIRKCLVVNHFYEQFFRHGLIECNFILACSTEHLKVNAIAVFLGTIHILRQHIFGPFLTHPLCQHK